MTTQALIKKYGPAPAQVISNSKNQVSSRCISCNHLNVDYAKCMKSGTCIYDLADLAIKTRK